MVIEPNEDRQAYLDKYGLELEGIKNEAVEWRRPFENRWIESEEQERGGVSHFGGIKDRDGYSTSTGDLPAHQRAKDNVTRTIVRKNISRANDMLFSTDSGESFDIEPTPVNNDPNITVEAAERSADAMEKQIKDYLAEGDYAGEGRLIISDGFRAGTGILHGPYPKRSKRKAANTTYDELGNPVTTLVFEEVIKPGFERIEYRMFYPRPCRNIEECEGVFLLYLMPARKIKELAGKDAFDAEQIERLLALPGGADPGSLIASPITTAGGDVKLLLKNKYPVWKYIGQIKKKCACLMGDEEGKEDVNDTDTVGGEVWFSQGITLKAVPSDTDNLPFHIFNYTRDPGSIFGYSLPSDLRDDQFDINLAWAAMKLNAMASAFPIVGILKGSFETENGDISYPPSRPIILKGSKVSDCIDIVPIPSTTGDVERLLDRAKANANEHGMVQTMEESAPASANIGVGLFAMIKSEDNVIQANTARMWDDSITKPFLTQMIEYELLYGKNEAAKGVFDVVPKASSNLLSKDIQLQNAIQLLTLADNPQNAPYFKRYEALRIAISRTPFSVDQVLNTEEQVAEEQAKQAEQQTPDQVQAELERYKVDKMIEAANIKAQADLKIAQMRSEGEILVARMTLEAANIKAASDDTANAAETATRERIAQLSEEGKRFTESLRDTREREKNASRIAIEAEGIAQKEKKLNAQVTLERPFRVL